MRTTPIVLLLAAAACGPSVVNCPPGHYVDDDGMCVAGVSDTAGGPVGDDDDTTLDGFDDDGDGWAESVGDCDDTDPNIHPDAEEDLGNGVDDDCDRSIDEVEQSMADRLVEPNTAAACDGAGAWSAYQDMPTRYVAVTVFRVGSTSGQDLPSLSEVEGAVADANDALATAGLELFVESDQVVYESDFHDLDPTSFTTLRNQHDDDGTLHLFVTGTVTDANGEDARGLAIAPGGERNHGVAISRSALLQARALAHLVGHGLGLVHTHAGTANGLDPELVDGSNCGQSGDALCDTPADPGPSWGFEEGCGVDANACALVGCGADADGTPFAPDIDNVMSVYPDDCGTPSFSDDQGARMRCSVDVDLPGVLLLEEPAIGPVVDVLGHSIQDDVAGPSDGDGDGSWELGETIEIMVDLANVGAEPASNVVAVLSDNQSLVSLTTAQQTVGTMAVGAQDTVTFVAGVPLACTTDFVTTFTVTTSDDQGNQWADSFDVPVSCDAEVDIEALSATMGSATLRPGTPGDFDLAVRNNSVIPMSNVELDVYLSQDATVDPATDTFVCRETITDTIAAGASRTFTSTCTVPAALGAGSWRVGFLADPDDVLAEIDETNNEAVSAGSAPMQTPPNLTIDGVAFSPSTVAPGADLGVDYTRGNDGGTNASGFDLGVYLSTDATITAADNLLCTVGGLSANAGSSLTTGVTCTVPNNTPLGDYYVGAIIDDGNDVVESDETDNVAVSPTQVTIDGDVDLQPTAFNILSNEGFAGSTFDVELVMQNNGSFDADPFDIGVLFSADGTVTTSDTLACAAVTPGSLGAGDSIALTVTGCQVPAAPIGDYTLGVWLDSSTDIAESNENNNILADTNDVFTVRGIDLYVHSIDLPAATSGNPGDNLVVTYTRENLGNAAAGTFRLSVMLSADSTIDTSDTQACYADVTAPANHSITTGLTGCTVPSLPAGTYYAGVLIDSLDDVVEVDESNNAASSTVTFTVL